VFALEVLETHAVHRIRIGGRNTAPAGAITQRHHRARLRAEFGHPVFHRAVGKHVESARIVGAEDDRAFEDEQIELLLAAGDVAEQLLDRLAHLHPQRGMPEQVNPEVRDEVARARLFGVQKRHRVAGTRAALQPQDRCHEISLLLGVARIGRGRWEPSRAMLRSFGRRDNSKN
jgi:hypothetical protein